MGTMPVMGFVEEEEAKVKARTERRARIAARKHAAAVIEAATAAAAAAAAEEEEEGEEDDTGEEEEDADGWDGEEGDGAADGEGAADFLALNPEGKGAWGEGNAGDGAGAGDGEAVEVQVGVSEDTIARLMEKDALFELLGVHHANGKISGGEARVFAKFHAAVRCSPVCVVCTRIFYSPGALLRFTMLLEVMLSHACDPNGMPLACPFP
jgi:hypothetical protein